MNSEVVRNQASRGVIVAIATAFLFGPAAVQAGIRAKESLAHVRDVVLERLPKETYFGKTPKDEPCEVHVGRYDHDPSEVLVRIKRVDRNAIPAEWRTLHLNREAQKLKRFWSTEDKLIVRVENRSFRDFTSDLSFKLDVDFKDGAPVKVTMIESRMGILGLPLRWPRIRQGKVVCELE